MHFKTIITTRNQQNSDQYPTKNRGERLFLWGYNELGNN